MRHSRLKATRRHVIAEGFIGEWNLRPQAFRFSAGFGPSASANTALCGAVFKRANSIAGVKRRKGERAVRVRIVLEEL